jgi:hypothetical protein
MRKPNSLLELSSHFRWIWKVEIGEPVSELGAGGAVAAAKVNDVMTCMAPIRQTDKKKDFIDLRPRNLSFIIATPQVFKCNPRSKRTTLINLAGSCSVESIGCLPWFSTKQAGMSSHRSDCRDGKSSSKI